MALDPAAVRAANARLHAAHPELGGRLLTRSRGDTALRREWMRYYREISAPPAPPPPAETPSAEPTPLPDHAAKPVQECEAPCEDDAGTSCNCCDMETITFYVQKGDPATSIALDYLKGEILNDQPSPNTGHAFIAIGDGELADKRAYGFYPASSWFGATGGINTNDGFYVPGRDDPLEEPYSPENEHPFTHQKSFKACPSKVAAMEAAILADIELIKKNDPGAPKYDLTNLQCTTWAEKHLSTLGFSPPTSTTPRGAAEQIHAESSVEAGTDGKKPW